MAYVLEDGLPTRDHLEASANSLFPVASAADKLSSAPDVPKVGYELWAHFKELHSRREYSQVGPVRFAWRDIEAYMNVICVRLNNWELQTIFDIEAAYFDVLAEHKK